MSYQIPEIIAEIKKDGFGKVVVRIFLTAIACALIGAVAVHFFKVFKGEHSRLLWGLHEANIPVPAKDSASKIDGNITTNNSGNLNQINQDNSGAGVVNNDLSIGKKSNTQTSKEDNAINAPVTGIVNQGGKGNTYNQKVTFGNPQRTLDKKAKSALSKQLLPSIKTFIVEAWDNDEAQQLAGEYVPYLQSLGFQWMGQGTIQGMMNESDYGKIEYLYERDSTQLKVRIYPVKMKSE